MVVQEEAINNIMGGLEGTAGVKLHMHRRKLKQRFDIIKKLGQGTYGKVQLGVNKETGQEVAIKTIKKCKIETEADLIRIRREIQIMSSLRHPYIIHIYEVFENKEKMVLVMEYSSGGELYDYLSEKKVLEEKEARRIFRQVAMAIYYCHKHQICHRDLKLENILLDEDGNAKIADFGLSNVFDSKRLLSTFCGSPLYASPEIVKGIPYHGPEVDCWSLGVLLYTLVYGAMPFDGMNFKRLVRQISNGEFYEPKVPSNASGLIRGLLTVSSEDRLNIEQVCNHPWLNPKDEQQMKPCIELAIEFSSETPVRLDLLLSLPQTNSNAVSSNETTQVVKDTVGSSIPKRSHSMGSMPPPLPSNANTMASTTNITQKRSPQEVIIKDKKPKEKPVKKTVKKRLSNDDDKENMMKVLDDCKKITKKLLDEEISEDSDSKEPQVTMELEIKSANKDGVAVIPNKTKVEVNLEDESRKKVTPVSKEKEVQLINETEPKENDSVQQNKLKTIEKSDVVENKDDASESKKVYGSRVSDAKAAFERQLSVKSAERQTPTNLEPQNYMASTVHLDQLIKNEVGSITEDDDNIDKLKKENAIKVISNAISESALGEKRASTLPRRKLSMPAPKQFVPKPFTTDVPSTLYQPIPAPRPSLKKQESAPSSVNISKIPTGQTSREHIIPIFVEARAEKPETQPVQLTKQSSLSSNSAGSASSISKQDSWSSVTTTSTVRGEPIRKSPREVIIPIAVEGQGIITPSQSTLEKMSSVDESETESTTSKARSKSFFPTGFGLHSTKRRIGSRTKPLMETTDSLSSDEDDDNFEILTAENLFSQLLSRVRNLTQRLNDEPVRPFPRLFNHSIFEDYPSCSSVLSGRSGSESPDLSTTSNTTTPWRRHTSSTASGSSSTLPRDFSLVNRSFKRFLSTPSSSTVLTSTDKKFGKLDSLRMTSKLLNENQRYYSPSKPPLSSSSSSAFQPFNRNRRNNIHRAFSDQLAFTSDLDSSYDYNNFRRPSIDNYRHLTSSYDRLRKYLDDDCNYKRNIKTRHRPLSFHDYDSESEFSKSSTKKSSTPREELQHRYRGESPFRSYYNNTSSQISNLEPILSPVVPRRRISTDNSGKSVLRKYIDNSLDEETKIENFETFKTNNSKLHSTTNYNKYNNYSSNENIDKLINDSVGKGTLDLDNILLAKDFESQLKNEMKLKNFYRTDKYDEDSNVKAKLKPLKNEIERNFLTKTNPSLDSQNPDYKSTDCKTPPSVKNNIVPKKEILNDKSEKINLEVTNKTINIDNKNENSTEIFSSKINKCVRSEIGEDISNKYKQTKNKVCLKGSNYQSSEEDTFSTTTENNSDSSFENKEIKAAFTKTLASVNLNGNQSIKKLPQSKVSEISSKKLDQSNGSTCKPGTSELKFSKEIENDIIVKNIEQSSNLENIKYQSQNSNISMTETKIPTLKNKVETLKHSNSTEIQQNLKMESKIGNSVDETEIIIKKDTTEKNDKTIKKVKKKSKTSSLPIDDKFLKMVKSVDDQASQLINKNSSTELLNHTGNKVIVNSVETSLKSKQINSEEASHSKQESNGVDIIDKVKISKINKLNCQIPKKVVTQELSVQENKEKSSYINESISSSKLKNPQNGELTGEEGNIINKNELKSDIASYQPTKSYNIVNLDKMKTDSKPIAANGQTENLLREELVCPEEINKTINIKKLNNTEFQLLKQTDEIKPQETSTYVNNQSRSKNNKLNDVKLFKRNSIATEKLNSTDEKTSNSFSLINDLKRRLSLTSKTTNLLEKDDSAKLKSNLIKRHSLLSTQNETDNLPNGVTEQKGTIIPSDDKVDCSILNSTNSERKADCSILNSTNSERKADCSILNSTNSERKADCSILNSTNSERKADCSILNSTNSERKADCSILNSTNSERKADCSILNSTNSERKADCSILNSTNSERKADCSILNSTNSERKADCSILNSTNSERKADCSILNSTNSERKATLIKKIIKSDLDFNNKVNKNEQPVKSIEKTDDVVNLKTNSSKSRGQSQTPLESSLPKYELDSPNSIKNLKLKPACLENNVDSSSINSSLSRNQENATEAILTTDDITTKKVKRKIKKDSSIADTDNIKSMKKTKKPKTGTIIEKTIKTLRRNSIGYDNEFSESKLLKRATSLESLDTKTENSFLKNFFNFPVKSKKSSQTPNSSAIDDTSGCVSDADCVSERIRRKSFYNRFNQNTGSSFKGTNSALKRYL